MAIVANKTQVQAYLQFHGRTEEALAFYSQALGAETVMMMRFSDNPDGCAEGSPPDDKVMHACFKVGETEVFATDGGCNSGGQSAGFQGFSLSLSLPDGLAAERAYNALSEGGQVHMPMTKTFFASHFGLVSDKFGVSWMILVPS